MWEILIKSFVLAGGLMTAAAYLVLLERKMAAWVQDRCGPNRVGIPLTNIRLFGLGQPIADGLKFILKEEFTPAHVDRRLFVAAPIIMLTSALSVFAVIPFGDVIPPLKLWGWGWDRPIPLAIAPHMDTALLFVFALNSIAVYGVILGGWASNNKYSLLGGLRSSAQLIAYELALSLGILGVVLASGSLNIRRIVEMQAETGVWFVLAQPIGFVVFVTAAFAEAARLPFDLPECEQELVGGYHTEYSGMKLLLFLIAEFLHMVTAAMLIVLLFLGGWHFWGITSWADSNSWLGAILRVVVFAVKTVGVILFFMLVRWSWPRFRFDQLMALAWKVMLPLGLLSVAVVAVVEQSKLSGLESWLGRVPAAWLMVIPAWVVAALAWWVVAVAGPSISDNTPRREPAGWDVQF
ncbi:MAG: NADH-quinone oxidoreductase subunit H 2 [Pirellulaceae bacterium]|nr:MAG: NADH-quinone oxidoreductase subunit H 2 [Pirellulaceae bacterium]